MYNRVNARKRSFLVQVTYLALKPKVSLKGHSGAFPTLQKGDIMWKSQLLYQG